MAFRTIFEMDAGELREYLAGVYRRDLISLGERARARRAIRRVARLLGVTEAAVIAQAIADAAVLAVVEEG